MQGYPDVYNPDLLDRIPLDARVVLDVGCGAGSLGAEYKRRNPACLVLGIEADLDAARIAGTRLDRVAHVDVELEPMPFPGVAIDCIVYGDVLEHLRDPWGLLKRHAQALAPTGVVLICMPNAAHWSFADSLLRGTFDYEELGLFDRTHLRWFTFDMTRRALADAGLMPQSVTPRVFDLPKARAFTQAITPGLASLGIDAADYLQRAAPLQFVWRATPSDLPKLHIVSTMLAPVGGVSDVRVTEPIAAIGTDPSIITTITRALDTPDLPQQTPKIFILHRPKLTPEQGLGVVRRLAEKGYLVVVEFDDHPDYIAESQRPDLQNFRCAHAVQTSTQPLADVFRQLNPEVMVFPNAIRSLPTVCNHVDRNRLTLFFGGLNRQEDWPPFLPVLNAVAALAGDRLQFKIVNDRGLFEGLETPYKSFTPLCDYATYRALLAQCELSFMPLADTPFNRCKSDLKFLEAAAHRVTALASSVVYGSSIEDGRTGLVFSSPAELQQCLLRMLSDPALCQTIGDHAREYAARDRMLAYQVKQRNDWYRSLWDRRESLHASLVARVPDLFGAVSR